MVLSVGSKSEFNPKPNLTFASCGKRTVSSVNPNYEISDLDITDSDNERSATFDSIAFDLTGLKAELAHANPEAVTTTITLLKEFFS